VWRFGPRFFALEPANLIRSLRAAQIVERGMTLLTFKMLWQATVSID